MALNNFFVKYERFYNNFWKWYKKVPLQPIFLPHLPQIRVFSFMVDDSDNSHS